MLTTSFFHLLLLIIVANGSPIVLRDLLGERLDYALDCGAEFIDGHRLLGGSKTWRGLLGAVIFTAAAGVMLGYSVTTGLLVGLLAMLGDISASFIKRRLNLPPSSMAPLLDQIPESILPALVLQQQFDLDLLAIIILIVFFIIFELSISIVLFRLGIRKRPY
jgi:CDP-2,3-bis-(O-geranylgeranyl)-sn-glycerol synthase